MWNTDSISGFEITPRSSSFYLCWFKKGVTCFYEIHYNIGLLAKINVSPK
jgi:hypothetical protein